MLLSVCLFACSNEAAQQVTKEKRIQEIDKQLVDLAEQLHLYRIREMNDEMEGQPAMLGEYNKFSKKINEAEFDKKAEKAIAKKIADLLNEKRELQK